jgi:hypothetical protein
MNSARAVRCGMIPGSRPLSEAQLFEFRILNPVQCGDSQAKKVKVEAAAHKCTSSLPLLHHPAADGNRTGCRIVPPDATGVMTSQVTRPSLLLMLCSAQIGPYAGVQVDGVHRSWRMMLQMQFCPFGKPSPRCGGHHATAAPRLVHPPRAAYPCGSPCSGSTARPSG